MEEEDKIIQIIPVPERYEIKAKFKELDGTIKKDPVIFFSLIRHKPAGTTLRYESIEPITLSDHELYPVGGAVNYIGLEIKKLRK